MPHSDEGIIEWVNDGHQLKLGVEVNLGNIRTCLSCGALRGHLDLDYVCVECRVSNGHGVPWDEIEVTHKLICPFEQMDLSKYERFLEMDDRTVVTPPNCSRSACFLAAEIAYEGLPDTAGPPGKRVPMETLEIPLFEKIPIVYILEISHYPGGYDVEAETDIEFGWLPANLADFKQGR